MKTAIQFSLISALAVVCIGVTAAQRESERAIGAQGRPLTDRRLHDVFAEPATSHAE